MASSVSALRWPGRSPSRSISRRPMPKASADPHRRSRPRFESARARGAESLMSASLPRGAFSNRIAHGATRRPGAAHRDRRRWAPAARSATAAGRIRGGAMTRAMASDRSTISMRSSPSSRSGAAGCTASAGRTMPISNPARRASAIAAIDQAIGTGDGAPAAFQLVKRYGAGLRDLSRGPSQAGGGHGADRGRWRCADGRATHFTVDAATGVVTFRRSHSRGRQPR